MLISSLGWVDHDALWCFDVSASRAERLPLGTDARHLSLHSSGLGKFSVGHHFGGARFELNVHSFSDPSRALARAVFKEGERTLIGDASAWSEVPLLYTEFLEFEPWKDFALVKIDPSSEQIEPQRLKWYDDTYDKGYQGVVGVLEIPGEDFALISVQRSSRLILHDLNTGMKRGIIDLGDRGGNPALQFGNAGKEIWASDYDTLVVIQRSDLQVLRHALMQTADAGTRLFIGDYAFAPDQDICVVARPFSGDVVGIVPASLMCDGRACRTLCPVKRATRKQAAGRGPVSDQGLRDAPGPGNRHPPGDVVHPENVPTALRAGRIHFGPARAMRRLS